MTLTGIAWIIVFAIWYLVIFKDMDEFIQSAGFGVVALILAYIYNWMKSVDNDKDRLEEGVADLYSRVETIENESKDRMFNSKNNSDRTS